MFKKCILLFCVCSMALSCYNYNEPKKPEKLISEEQMTLVLIDLKLIGAVTAKNKKVIDSANITPLKYIKDKYGIDSLQFEENNTYYSYHLDKYQNIFDKVKDSLSKLKTHYEALVKEERLQKQKQDSLEQIQRELEKIEMHTELEAIDIDAELEDIELIEPVSSKD